MSNIEHNDVFELLAIDMDMPQEEIKDTLLSKGTNEFIHFIKKKNLWIHKTELKLTHELKDEYGKTLINKGIPINKYLTSLLDRYVKDDKFSTTPLCIECTDSVLRMYRGKTSDKVNYLMDNYVYQQDTSLMLLEHDPSIKDSFNGVINELTSTPKGICTFLKMLSNFNENKHMIINSLSSSLVTLCLASQTKNKSQESSETLINKAGILCLLQNIADIAGDKLCGMSSPDIIKMLINDEAMEVALATYIASANDDAPPVFSKLINKTNYHLRMLVTVRLFVDLLAEYDTDPQNLEIHKALHELAERGGHADKEIVSIIGKLFLPEAKHLILEHAYKIKNSCANFPIIWSTVGDMLPVKFLCTTESCNYSGGHKTLISKDVSITVKKYR